MGQGSAGRFYPELVAFEGITWGNAKTFLNLSFPSRPPVWALNHHLKKSLAPQSFPILIYLLYKIFTLSMQQSGPFAWPDGFVAARDL